MIKSLLAFIVVLLFGAAIGALLAHAIGYQQGSHAFFAVVTFCMIAASYPAILVGERFAP